MTFEIKAPHYPESIEDGTLVTWYKREGDAVGRDEKLADIETDKVVLEVAAPEEGVLTSILKKEGDIVLDSEVLAVLDTNGQGASGAVSAKTEAVVTEPLVESGVSPAVRKLLVEHDLDPADIKGSGKGGRITKADVQAHLKASPVPPAAEPPAPPPVPATPVTGTGRAEERVPMSRLRARVAERLVAVQQETAMLSTFNEVNMQPVMELRKQYKERFEKEHGVKLGFMSFFVKAAVEALKRFPAVNASIDGTDVVYHGYFDIGIAVSTERGLVVPILRNADLLSFAQIEASIENFAQRARENQLTLDELTGGTFTLTNGGVFGSLLSTPILNPPQSGILGMHRIQERPVAENGQVVVRPMMYLALSYDHRIIDGRDAVQFLIALRDVLEDPARLLLQV